MPTSPKNVMEKVEQVAQAWESLRPAKTFAGMTLTQFKAKIQASSDTRAAIIPLQAALTQAQNRRDDADKISLAAVSLVVKSVVGDIEEGDDGDLYEAMGYVRKSERKSGLTRRNSVKKEAVA